MEKPYRIINPPRKLLIQKYAAMNKMLFNFAQKTTFLNAPLTIFCGDNIALKYSKLLSLTERSYVGAEQIDGRNQAGENRGETQAGKAQRRLQAKVGLMGRMEIIGEGRRRILLLRAMT